MDSMEQCIARETAETVGGPYNIKQYLLVVLVALECCAAGSMMSFSSVFIQQLHEYRELELDTDQISWIASLPILVMLPVQFTIGWLLNLLGRRFCLRLAASTMFTSWLYLFFSTTYHDIMVARFVSGISLGIGYASMIVFLGEVTHPRIRPYCITAISVGAFSGVFLTQFLGNFIHWRTLALLVCLMPLTNFTVLLFARESYIWYLMKNKVEEAAEAFAWYRGQDPSAKIEFLATVDSRSNQLNSPASKLRFFLTRSFLVPFLLSTLLFCTGILAGDNAVIFYTSTFVNIVSDNADVQFYANSLLNVVRVLATLSCSLLYRKYAIRTVLIASGYLLALSLCNVALFIHLNRMYPHVVLLTVVCMFSIVMNVVLYSIGLGPIPAIICAEIYPIPVRDVGGALSTFVMSLSLFGVVKIMPHLFLALDPALIFLSFAFCTFVGISVLHFVLPNTQDKTLHEIEKLY